MNKRQEQLKQDNQSFSLTDLQKVITEGALLRIRPIMMTATAIIAGLLLIMLGSGTGQRLCAVSPHRWSVAWSVQQL